jgi:hypothetical protein
MHVEQNVSDNVLKHLFGEKDTLNTRDMEEVGESMAMATMKVY